MHKLLLLSAVLCFMTGAGAETLIVGNKAEDSVSFIDLKTGREVARRATGKAPHEIAVSPDGATAVVVSYRSGTYTGNTLHLFDVETAEPAGTIDLGPHRAPHGLKWIPGTGRVIVTTEASRDVAVVDIAQRRPVWSVKTDQEGTHMVALSPDGRSAYTANIGSGTFSVIDLKERRKVTDIAAGIQTEAIAVSPDGRTLFVGNNGSKTVLLVDTATLKTRRTIATEGIPIRVEVHPDGGMIAVSQPDLARVTFYAVNADRELARVDLAEAGGEVPVTLLFSDDGSRLWAAATGSARVIEIDTEAFTIARSFDAGRGSDGLGHSPVTVAAKD